MHENCSATRHTRANLHTPCHAVRQVRQVPCCVHGSRADRRPACAPLATISEALHLMLVVASCTWPHISSVGTSCDQHTRSDVTPNYADERHLQEGWATHYQV